MFKARPLCVYYQIVVIPTSRLGLRNWREAGRDRRRRRAANRVVLSADDYVLSILVVIYCLTRTCIPVQLSALCRELVSVANCTGASAVSLATPPVNVGVLAR
jgi:hypothetical protein